MSNFKTERIRSPKHQKMIKGLPCIIKKDGLHCNGKPVDGHHITTLEGQGIMGDKAGDEWLLPLCRMHHNSLHHIGEERFWQSWSIDEKEECRKLASISPDKRIRKTVTIKKGIENAN